ncbi:hypothetical protein BC628DRAFT_763972 [Trametes gibbosa]|nr:hypothetical protein BC628DRAFT_763972 [Trametes gibbosa]
MAWDVVLQRAWDSRLPAIRPHHSTRALPPYAAALHKPNELIGWQHTRARKVRRAVCTSTPPIIQTAVCLLPAPHVHRTLRSQFPMKLAARRAAARRIACDKMSPLAAPMGCVRYRAVPAVRGCVVCRHIRRYGVSRDERAARTRGWLAWREHGQYQRRHVRPGLRARALVRKLGAA